MILIKLMKQDLMNLIKTPVIVAAGTYLPLILMFIFGFVFSSLYGGDGITSYDYYGVTTMMFIILECVTITPNTFFEEKLKEGNMRIAFSPVSRVYVYVSKIISSFIIMAVFLTTEIVVLNYLNIVNFGGYNLKYILLLFAAFLFFAVTLGGAACVILKSEELTNNILTVIVGIVSLLGGVFFPLDSLGSLVSTVSNLCPLKWIVDVTFNIIYDGNFTNYKLVISALMALSVIFIIIINFCYKQEDYIEVR